MWISYLEAVEVKFLESLLTDCNIYLMDGSLDFPIVFNSRLPTHLVY